MAFSDVNMLECLELIPMNLTDNKKVLLQAIITNILNNKICVDSVTPQFKLKLDDLDARIIDYLANNSGNNDEFMEILQKVIDLQSAEDVGSTIVNSLGQIYNVLNGTEEVNVFEVLVDTSNGILPVDLTSYNFASPDDYTILLSVKDMLPVRVNYSNKTATSFDVTLRDKREWEFNEDSITTLDATTTPVTISVAVIFKLPSISTTVRTAQDKDNDGILDVLPIG